jgi:hypothetical protein
MEHSHNEEYMKKRLLLYMGVLFSPKSKDALFFILEQRHALLMEFKG